jgi:hypothetical protein
MTPNLKRLRTPILPDRVRQIAGQGFAFVPHRFLRDGFLTALDRDQLALYVFLLLAANRHGVSFHGYDAICATLRMPLECYLQARNALIAQDLIAFDGTRFQVLSLPDHCPTATESRPLRNQADYDQHDSATIRAMILDGLHRDRDK